MRSSSLAASSSPTTTTASKFNTENTTVFIRNLASDTTDDDLHAHFTDSFGPELQPVTNGLGFLPGANGVHMNTEDRRRPLLHELVAAGTLGPALCTDDGAGLLFRGTELVEAVSEVDGARVTRIERTANGGVIETGLSVRRLGQEL